MRIKLSSLFKGPKADSTVTRYVCWLIGFFAFLDVYSVQSILPMIQVDFHATSLQAGLVVGVTLFAIAIISPFMGLISDRLGRKNILLGAMVLLAIPTSLIPFCNQIYTLMLLRFLQGLAIPGIVVVTVAYIAEESPITRLALMTTAYVSGTVMGGFSGRFITGYVSGLLGNWRAGFMVLAALNILGVFFVLKLLPESKNFTPTSNIRQGFFHLKSHIYNPKVVAASVVGFCVLFSLASVFTYINFLLVREPYHLSVTGLANIFCIYLLGVVITPLSGRIIEQIGYRYTLLFALTAAASGLCLTLYPSLVVIIVGLAIFSSGIFICQSATIGFIASNVVQGRSLAMGVYNLLYYLGGAIGTWIVGISYFHWGWLGAVLTIVLMQAVAGMTAWFCWKSNPSRVVQTDLKN